uniref:UspA domain-containing protein n=1 Tax=Helicotheca tamesis TaxID=374047 RepID=A0A7S2N0T1_9STRA|mmetsp:Transcript_7116/g.9632  ORF Transcript_7116/g.9632 Transcript_7116/m.9632 type:complete len:355 (+) Transcript_7116:112-1176(+)
MIPRRTTATVLLLIVATTSAFSGTPSRSVVRSSTAATFVSPSRQSRHLLPSALASSKRESDTIEEAAKTKGKGSAVDPEVRSKLLTESIAPWRTLRLFLYASLGSGALLGGFITLSGVAAFLSGVRDDVDLNTEYLNLAIDFGAAIAFAFLAKWDFDKGAELSENVEKKLERKKEQRKITNAMREREDRLSKLSLNVRVSDGGDMQTATVSALQSGAKQHMVIVAGNRKAIRDALLGANFLKMEFAVRNLLVVPYEISEETEKQVRPSGGFGERPAYETQPYVAEVVGDGWEEYIEEEMIDAVKQGGEKVKEEGIAIVLANDGKVIRRGVGTVPWRKMVEELETAVTGEKQELL